MRRGRPTPSQAPKAAKAVQQQAASGDPFAALDSKSPLQGGSDEFSSRFPSLDQFSLLHDQGSKFEFESAAPSAARSADASKQTDAHRMADEVFASSRTPPTGSSGSRPQSVTPGPATPKIISQHIATLSKTSSGPSKPEMSRASSIIRSNPDLRAISSQNTSKYVSIGTSTSDLPTTPPANIYSQRGSPALAAEPSRSSSRLGHAGSSGELASAEDGPSLSVSARISSLESRPAHARTSSTTRSSAERRPQEDLLDFSPQETLSAGKQRPRSTNFETATTTDYLRKRETLSRPQSRPSPRELSLAPSPKLIPTDDEPAAETTASSEAPALIEDAEVQEPEKPQVKRLSSSSMPGPKNTGPTTFGSAFKRFEAGQPASSRTPSPLKENAEGFREPSREPNAWPKAQDDKPSLGQQNTDPDMMTPEMRREMERLKLEEEEQRVEAAQAEYRRRVAAGGAGAPSRQKVSGNAPPRTMSIQNRVQSLMQENRNSNVPRTAHGYGKYSDTEPTSPGKVDKPLPELPPKPTAGHRPPGRPLQSREGGSGSGTSSTPPLLAPNKPAAKPVAPKKPVHLNSLPTGTLPSSASKTTEASTTEQLIAIDVPGQPALDMTAKEKDDYLEDFSQRFPSLSAMEGGRANSGPGR